VNKITPRTWTFILAGIALLALILLSISLTTLELGAGHPFSFRRVAPSLVDQSVSPGFMRNFLIVFRIIMIIGWVLLPIYIILLFISKDERKRFLRFIATILPFVILLYFFASNQASRDAAEDLTPRLFGDVGTEEFASTPIPPPEFTPPPAWVTTLTTVTIALVISLILIGIFYAIWRRSQERFKLKEPLKKVERQAQAALDNIRAGGDLSEAILRCYLQMVESLKEYRGIYRDQDMTPHEFEIFLSRYGIPGEPVHQLTRLFEEVR
jgi:HAMP domain-containing protein